MSSNNRTNAPAVPSTENGYTAAHVAAEFGITPFACRTALRAACRTSKPGGRWTWANKNDPALIPIRAAVKKFLADAAGSGATAAKPTSVVTPPAAPAKPDPVPTTAAKSGARKITAAAPAKPTPKPAPAKPATPRGVPRPGPAPAAK